MPYWSTKLARYVPDKLVHLCVLRKRGLIGITRFEEEARRLGFTRSEAWIVYGEFWRTELIPFATWHIIVYKRYIATKPKDTRHFEVHIFTAEKLRPEEAVSKAREIFINMLRKAGKGSDAIEGYVALWDEVLALASVGYEALPFEVRGWIIVDLAMHYAPYIWYDVRGIRPLRSYRMLNLGIDLDNISYTEAVRILRQVRAYPLIRSATLYETRQGYHIRAILASSVEFKRKAELREMWHDDPDRLSCDYTKMSIGNKALAIYGPTVLILAEGITDVLFHEKYKPELDEMGRWTGRWIVSKERKIRI